MGPVSIVRIDKCDLESNNLFNLQSGYQNLTVYANDTAGNLGSQNIAWNYTLLENGRSYNSSTIATSSNEDESSLVKGLLFDKSKFATIELLPNFNKNFLSFSLNNHLLGLIFLEFFLLFLHSSIFYKVGHVLLTSFLFAHMVYHALLLPY